MPVDWPFTWEHVSSLSARAAELERLGEREQDPGMLVRAARLYTLATRIADDIDEREAVPFLHSDLSRVRDELRTLATDLAASPNGAERVVEADRSADSTGSLTRMFREIALRIEQRLTDNQKASPPDGMNPYAPSGEPRSPDGT